MGGVADDLQRRVKEIRLVVNGTMHTVPGAPQRPLLHVLREDLGLTGAKYGCGEGACGVCTVLVDGEPRRACITPLAEVASAAITTVEGLAGQDRLHLVQRAFVAEHAFQCGYCTPGMVVACAALLRDDPAPDDAAIRVALEGNICRCGTHARIVRAVRRVVDGDLPEPAPTSVSGPGTGAVTPEPAPDLPEPWDLAQDGAALFDALGDGLLATDAPARCWIHVGADGRIRIASGKVEVGQGSTAELVRVAAEELWVDPAELELILGDTDLSPFDMGTFGSRTTPDVVPAVAAAAATAREALRDLAAGGWNLDRAAVEARAGCIRSLDGRHAASYAELVTGGREERVADETARSALAAGRLVGTSLSVRDDVDVVTGQRRYTTDLRLPGMLHAAVLRPPATGGTLVEADTSAAERLPGVLVIREEGFVAVAAPNPLAARDAIAAVQARWELDPAPAESDLFDHLRSHPRTVQGWGGGAHEEVGDVEAALADAPVGVSSTYTAAYIAHQPLETRAALATWSEGRLTVLTGTQQPFGAREELAEALGLEERAVRVIASPTGSGYGGKHTSEAAIEAARISRALGRPVKVRWTREEETSSAYFRPAALIDVRSGATQEGDLVGWELVNINSGARAIHPPYRVPAWRAVYRPAESPLAQGSYRALSATANSFARESHLDELAAALGKDPYELRLRLLADARLADVLRAAADAAGWRGPHIAEGHGMGIACSIEKDSRVATCAEVRAFPGRPLEILRIVTAFECGAIIDPDNLANQVEGAMVQGLGGALFEAIHFADGRITNAAQSAYRVPRFSDVPPVEVILVDRRDLPSAGGGETPLIALAPALANAIHAACGIRLRHLPLLPEGILPAS